ncbi:hypothetical protein [Desulfofustis limnaeus]|uniref:Uncharacterized protein n=1 Tax=Desulfofustis limnaeus TaxID=2740163 RepID=A0ABN6LZA1_9BACT|nr:hypothetical protein [Desulfofustis limnaeus]BDD85969.1 hypothetical protein DPPLL_03340 [Desulfofustis limnaeus]
MAKQLNLFSQPSLNIGKNLKEQLAKSAKESRFSREELLDRMNDLAGRYGVRLMKGNGSSLTMATLEKWLNPEALDYVPGINSLVIFCAATGDLEPMREVLAPLGGMLIDENDVILLSWAKEYQRAKDARSRMRKLEMEL